MGLESAVPGSRSWVASTVAPLGVLRAQLEAELSLLNSSILACSRFGCEFNRALLPLGVCQGLQHEGLALLTELLRLLIGI